MTPPNLNMTPPPGERLLRFVGDRVRFTLRAGAERAGWRALLRTNLGRAAARRREIIAAHAGGAAAAGACTSMIGCEVRVSGAAAPTGGAAITAAATTGGAAITGCAGVPVGLAAMSGGTAGARFCVAPTNNASS
jgi:hypothetical protein